MSLQRFPTDRAYFIAKELLTTERTYVKDLEVITVVRESMSACQHAAVLFVFSCVVLWVENIDYSGYLLHCRAPAKTQSGSDIGMFWQMLFNFFFHSPHSCSEMNLSVPLKAVNVKLCLFLKR